MPDERRITQGGMTTVAGNGGSNGLLHHPVATIGSIPMRPIAINIVKDVESQIDDGRDRISDLGYSEMDGKVQ